MEFTLSKNHFFRTISLFETNKAFNVGFIINILKSLRKEEIARIEKEY